MCIYVHTQHISNHIIEYGLQQRTLVFPNLCTTATHTIKIFQTL